MASQAKSVGPTAESLACTQVVGGSTGATGLFCLGTLRGGYYKAGDCGCYDLAEVTHVTTETPEAKSTQRALLGVLRQGVLEVIGDLQQETVLGVFTINGLSKRTIMKRLRQVKAHSEACLALAS